MERSISGWIQSTLILRKHPNIARIVYQSAELRFCFAANGTIFSVPNKTLIFTHTKSDGFRWRMTLLEEVAQNPDFFNLWPTRYNTSLQGLSRQGEKTWRVTHWFCHPTSKGLKVVFLLLKRGRKLELLLETSQAYHKRGRDHREISFSIGRKICWTGLNVSRAVTDVCGRT